MTAPIPLDLDRAKKLAALLRADLAAAGYPVPHSLTLELIAHQHGARDWNTLRARLTRPAPPTDPTPSGMGASEGPLEWETVQHTTTAMTVAQLRAAVDGLSPQMQVLVSQPTEPGPDAGYSVIPATSAEVGPGFDGSGEVVTLRGELLTGAHRRARRLTLILRGLPLNVDGNGDPAGVVERTRRAVDAAVEAATGGPGHQRFNYGYRLEEGIATWTWISGTTPLEHVAAVARAEIDSLNPGTWQVALQADASE